jgi:hypothetical protein
LTGRQRSITKPWMRYSATSAPARAPNTNQGGGSMTNSSGESDVGDHAAPR